MGQSYKQKSIWIIDNEGEASHQYREVLDLHYHTNYFKGINDYQNKLLENSSHTPDLTLIDMLEPDSKVFSCLTQNNKRTDTPFIVVSHLHDLDVLRFCFQEGACDYILKPLRNGEILAKIEKAIESTNGKRSNETRLNYDIQVDDIIVDGLTAIQHKIMTYFLSDSKWKASRDGLLAAVWTDSNVHPKTLDVHLYNLRRKLHGHGLMIRSQGNGVDSYVDTH